MKKGKLLFIVILLSTKMLTAQNVDEGKKFLYYDRFNSAKNTFNKTLESNAKDANAIYWLGQTYLKMDEIDSARNNYQNALQKGINDPIVLVGMGHVELLDGKKK